MKDTYIQEEFEKFTFNLGLILNPSLKKKQQKTLDSGNRVVLGFHELKQYIIIQYSIKQPL